MMRSTGSPNTKTTERRTDDEARAGRWGKRLGRAGLMLAAARHRFIARGPVLLPGVRLPARPSLLLLTALLLSLLCLVLTIRSRPPSPATAEFVLLSDPSSSNLNSTSAEAPARSPTPQAVAQQGSLETAGSGSPGLESPPARAQLSESAGPEVATPVRSPPATPALEVPQRMAAPTPEPVSPPPAELPRRLAAEDSLPILPATVLEPARENCYAIHDPHPGDTPMMRTWKMLGLKTLLAALFAATPGLGSSTSGPPSDTEKLEEIQKQLNELKNSLAEVKKSLTGLGILDERIKDVRTDSNVAVQKIQSQISDLNNQLIQLRSDLENLRNRPPSSTRIAASPPLDTAVTTGTARIEVMNTYSQPVSVVINNRRSYLLQPGERRLSDPVPAGSFSYEVLGITPMVTRTVAADKIFTVWVHPQP
jgi:hypothetical protein